MRIKLLVCVVALASIGLGGCKDKWDKAISQLDGFKDQMCACKDVACVDDVNKKMEAWEESMAKDMGKDEKPPEKLIEKGDAIEKELKKCKKDVKKAAGAGKAKEAMDKMVTFKDQMCACKDTACATKVSDDMTKWSQEQAKNAGDAPAMDEEMTKKMTEVGTQMGECMQKAMTPAAP